MASHATHSNAEMSTQVAQRLESAVSSNDTDAYNNVMKDVQNFSRSHSRKDSQATIDAINKKLEDDQYLPRVALYEAKKNFDLIDSDKDGKLSSSEIATFKQIGTPNGLSRNMIANVEQNIDQIGHKEGLPGFRSSVISKQDIDGHLAASKNLTHLLEKGEDGKSLYDRLTDKDGNIPTIGLDRKDKTKLSDEDNETLKYLQSQRNNWSKLPTADDMSSERLAEIFKAQDLDLNKLLPQATDGKKNQSAEDSSGADRAQQPAVEANNGRKNGSNGQSDESASPAQLAKIDAAHTKLDAEIKAALTVHHGESYWHSAERLLSLAGNNDPTSTQLHRLSHQLWVADGKRKANRLTTHDVLHISDQIMENRDVAMLFQH